MASASPEWKSTACILCSINCALQVQLDGRHLVKIRGDRSNPRSRGYTCEKQAGLDRYQNHRDRLTGPLRRRPGGGFDAVDWDTAIREVARSLGEIRDVHGGDRILYYGGGGQGNHLCGAYGAATARALGIRYRSNALAQEKTGEFWVEGQMFGGRPEPDFAHAQVAVFVGKNPWQSHGFERARVVLKQISKDPGRSLIVIDPRRTETAELADVFLQVRPGADAFLLSALLAVLVEEDLVDQEFLAERANGGGQVISALSSIPIADYCERAGVPEAPVRDAARRIGAAESASVVEDLGIEQAPHSTLNSYLEKLLYALTGNIAKPGAMNLGTRVGKLTGSSRGEARSPVGKHRIISGLLPCNAICEEILTDHPDRFRAMFVESANPAHSLANSPRMREALEALECVVVIDVAMTETAEHADYVLPACSQYEKWEATFFGGGFPENVFQLRPPLLAPLEESLPEPEIHRRLLRELGALRDEDVAELKATAEESRAAYQRCFIRTLSERPDLRAIAPIVLYETLGPSLGKRNEGAALLWNLAHTCASTYPDSVRRAGLRGEGPELGEALFDAILSRPEGVIVTVDPYEVTFERIRTHDGRVQLLIPELMEELAELGQEDPARRRDQAYPFVLAAGERRTSTANTIFRDPGWRKKDLEGALRMNPADAKRVGVTPGGRVRITTRGASVEAVVELTDTLQEGHVTLPNGFGVEYSGAEGERVVHGVAPNELTSSEERDWLAGTPWHKHVRARVEAIG